MDAPRTIIAARFGKEGSRTYDYFADFPVEKGQRVYVPTSRGKAKVTVDEIKTESDVASVAAIGPVEEDQESPDHE